MMLPRRCQDPMIKHQVTFGLPSLAKRDTFQNKGSLGSSPPKQGGHVWPSATLGPNVTHLRCCQASQDQDKVTFGALMKPRPNVTLPMLTQAPEASPIPPSVTFGSCPSMAKRGTP
ncbi:hypothetical protein PIB30_064465 [Stylosanthes scabra]|uniref:Uncharacterized protein n=1 Tax=Stylosanthes scabra TaxID=79078 RepID=A0ABU6WK29_9FABA|nr:hypothetical protein [Stylosanthes scabra]